MAYRVRFVPDNAEVLVPEGTDLLRAATLAGLQIKSSCGGDGVCGRCAVSIREGRVDEGNASIPEKLRKRGLVLACRARVMGDTVVFVPEESKVATHHVLTGDAEHARLLTEKETEGAGRYAFSPLGKKVSVSLDEPTLTENAADLARLTARLKKGGLDEVETPLSTLRRLPRVLRECSFRADVYAARTGHGYSIVDVRPGHKETSALGLAVDIGTTTCVVHLVDLSSGITLERRGSYNRQARYGDDVISRIIHASEGGEKLAELQQAVIGTINDLTAEALSETGRSKDDVIAVVMAGNTTMSHLALAVPPDFIRLEPYIPAATHFGVVRAREIGLVAHPEAVVHTVPSVASYVGGDIVSGVLASDLAHSDEVALFIDIGTNGEMVLGNRDWMVACACSAGPCFEGGGISCGMRATPGAIQRVRVDADGEVYVSTVGGERPSGVCGSGLVDCLSSLRRAGVIDRSGQFQTDAGFPRMRQTPDGWEYVLVWGRDSRNGEDIAITEDDVKNLLRAKGAVYAGIRSLLRAVDLPMEAVERIYIAGGFGSYLNVQDAVAIGLIPDVSPEKYVFLGNSSIKGARMCLLSEEALAEADELARKITYLELSVGNTFMEEFVSAMFIPHTDLSLFPSVEGAKEGIR
ncbi:MAG: ASKHA domain-containing protein [Bacillota bacterium]